MNRTLTFEDILCSEYERLLEECQRALAAWGERLDFIRMAKLSGEEIDRELLRLQVTFAASFIVLERHAHSCERCTHSEGGRQQFPEPIAFDFDDPALPN